MKQPRNILCDKSAATVFYKAEGGKKRMKNHLCGKNSEISARNRKRSAGGQTDGKMPEKAGKNVRT